MAEREPNEMREQGGYREKKRKRQLSQSSSAAHEIHSLQQPAQGLEPPPNLNRRQRKRWREKRNKKIRQSNEASAASSNRAPQNSTSSPAINTGRSSSTAVPIERQTLQRYRTTQLVQRPNKRWNESSHHLEQFEKAVRHQTASAKAPVNDATGHKQRYVPLGDSGQSSERALVSRSAEQLQADDLHKILGLESQARQRHLGTELEESQSRKIAPTSSATPFLLNGTPCKSVLGSQRASVSRRKSSFGIKANSVPSFSEETDVAASFKRFTAFLNGGESSDDDSVESSEDSENDGLAIDVFFTPKTELKPGATEAAVLDGDIPSISTGEKGTDQPQGGGPGSSEDERDKSSEGGESESDELTADVPPKLEEEPGTDRLEIAEGFGLPLTHSANHLKKVHTVGPDLSNGGKEETGEENERRSLLTAPNTPPKIEKRSHTDEPHSVEADSRPQIDEEPRELTERAGPDLLHPHQSSQDSQQSDKRTRFALFRSNPRPSTPTSWPANVGIKRQTPSPGKDQLPVIISADSAQPPGNPSNDALATDTNLALQYPSVFSDDGEASEDLFRTIDEITNAVFSSTRALPSKPLALSDPRYRPSRGNELMTWAYSNRPVTRSMTIPSSMSSKKIQYQLPITQENVIECRTVGIPDIKEPQVDQPKPDNTGTNNEAPGNEEIDNVGTGLKIEESSDSLSELSRSPSPPIPCNTHTHGDRPSNRDHELVGPRPLRGKLVPVNKKRKMTGMTSKHFTPEKPKPKLVKRQSAPAEMAYADDFSSFYITKEEKEIPIEPKIEPIGNSARSPERKQRKGTGRKSSYFTPPKPALDPNIIDRVDFYNTTAGGKSKNGKRVPAGTSTAPVPPISSERFGIIQEKLWQEPFWLLIAVTFLNKTTGRAAVPVFWTLKEQYQTPEALADAPQKDLETLVWHLGLQRQRSKRLIKIASAWVEAPAKRGLRWRTLNYPADGDGKGCKSNESTEGDSEDCAGLLEIGHIPGCGPYAWDSWRIFCRDVVRGVAQDYNGSEAQSERFVPEWKRVLPLDKELRACLRWMWLREGWIWDCKTGEKTQATDEEMRRAELGEMEFEDEKEREFAAQAAAAEVIEVAEAPVPDDDAVLLDQMASPELMMSNVRTPTPDLKNDSDNRLDDAVVVSPTRSKSLRRSIRIADLID